MCEMTGRNDRDGFSNMKQRRSPMQLCRSGQQNFSGCLTKKKAAKVVDWQDMGVVSRDANEEDECTNHELCTDREMESLEL